MFEEVDGSSDLEFATITIKIVCIQTFLIITDKSNIKEVLLEVILTMFRLLGLITIQLCLH